MRVEETSPESSVIRINVTIDDSDIFNGSINILEQIRPNWDKKEICFKLLTDGITNKLVGCNLAEAPEEDSVLVRIYGNKTDLLIDRKAETRNILLLNKLNLAPQLYATFNNGLAYQFVPGCTLSTKSVIQPDIYTLVATQMAKFHRVSIEGVKAPIPCLWNKMQNFLNLVPETFSDETKQKRFEELSLPSKNKLQQEKEYLEGKLSVLSSCVVFAHNDLLLGNVVYTPSQNIVTFIDFEYASFNFQAFDIGNHFAEFAGVDSPIYENYPSKEFQSDWLMIYLQEYNGRTPTEYEIETLYVQVNQFALAAHLFWGIWCYIQAEHSYIDFDFLKYASERLGEYFNRKQEFLGLQLPKYSGHL